MIFPRSFQQVVVLLVDLVAWPVNKAIDALDFSDIGDDETEKCEACGCELVTYRDCPWC